MRPMIQRQLLTKIVCWFMVLKWAWKPLLNWKQKVIVTGSGTIKTVYTDLGLGTGALINVVDGGTVVKTYTVVIFGDVNGDAIIDTNDLFVFEIVANGMGDFDTSACEFAADLNGDEVIDTMDTAVEEMAANSLIDINQVNPMESF